MKRQLYLYLFILSALITVFTYMYYSKALNFEKKNNAAEMTSLKFSLDSLKNKNEDDNHFSLESNQFAQEYLSDYNTQKLIPKIKDALLAFNDDSKGNIYTGQEKMGDQKFIINKIKILNHRWIIADYSDGTYWGDVLIKYFVEKDGKFSFQTMDTFIYPKEQY